jgi:hypothetical protein
MEFSKGFICMWAGDPKDIPTGWVLCDGRDHGFFKAPDLRSCFIVGAGEEQGYDKVNTAGEPSTISIEGAGKHFHNMGTVTAGINTHVGDTYLPFNPTSTVDDHVHTVKVVNKQGDEKTKGLLKPKWYALYYIVYIGT